MGNLPISNLTTGYETDDMEGIVAVDIVGEEPADWDMAMVFQQYALDPNM